MENNTCKKCFPKAFTNQTIIKQDGYPDYTHPDNRRTVQKCQDIFDNKVVVPHPRELLVQFDYHINLEVCGSIKAVKYIYKYIYKGPDCATVLTKGKNEIHSYLDARYISIQACHNIFEFAMHTEWPAVYCLSVHLPDHQSVIFQAEDEVENVLNNVKDTQLLGWFKANQDPSLIEAGAHNYLYQDFPKHFVWNKGQAVWSVCQRYKAIGHNSVPVTAGEAFYLHLLLTVVKGKINHHCEFIIHNSYLLTNRSYIL